MTEPINQSIGTAPESWIENRRRCRVFGRAAWFHCWAQVYEGYAIITKGLVEDEYGKISAENFGNIEFTDRGAKDRFNWPA